MEILHPIKIAEPNDDPYTIWENLKKFIEDENAVDDFDEIHELDDDDAEEFLIEEIVDYVNEEVVPDGLLFGIRKDTEEIGFWDEDDICSGESSEDKSKNAWERLDNLIDKSDTESESKTDGPIAQQGPLKTMGPIVQQGPLKTMGPIAQQGQLGTVEVLDDDGKVISESEYVKSNPDLDSNIIKVCMYCKKVTAGSDKKSWKDLTKSEKERTSHGICDKCMEEHYPESETDED